jgi:hypothetical protein
MKGDVGLSRWSRRSYIQDAVAQTQAQAEILKEATQEQRPQVALHAR